MRHLHIHRTVTVFLARGSKMRTSGIEVSFIIVDYNAFRAFAKVNGYYPEKNKGY